MMLKQVTCSLFLMLFVASCSMDSSFLRRKSNEVIAEVGNEKLLRDDLTRNLNFKNLSESDSLLVVDSYIKNWVSDRLMYNKAKSSIDNIDEVDSLVDVYKRSLIIYEYESQLVNEHLSDQMSDAQLRIYYKENSSLFTLTEPLLRGMLLVAYSDVPDLQVLESLMTNPTENNLDLISSVSVKNAAKFEYFVDNWLPLSEVQKNSPVSLRDKELRAGHLVSASDSVHTVFLYVQESKEAGDLQPFEYTKSRIRSILTEQSKNEYLRNYRKGLYEIGIQKGDAKRYK
ncbi:MAG: hypothetical protein IJJ77_03735 [Paludibacteraceae bacterium]|nr:hypothetical protein [Paludibacteraceae bacterium]